MDTPKFIVVTGEESIQGSEAWKSFRKDKIGASDVPTIMGVSPWESPREFFRRKVQGIELKKNSFMQRGNDLEATVRDKVNWITGRNYQPVVLQSCENPLMIASLDGMYVDKDGVHILEIKCPGKKAHDIARQGLIPEYYVPQVCYQYMISGATSALYASWDGYSDSPVIIDYSPDKGMCEKILKEVEKFIKDCQDLQAPDHQDRDWIHCYDDTLTAQAQRYKYLTEAIESYSAERDYIKESLLAKMDHPKTIVAGMKIQKVTRQGAIDYSLIPEIQNIDLDKYRKESTESWRISLD